MASDKKASEEAMLVEEVLDLVRGREGHIIYANTGQPYSMMGRLERVGEASIILVNKADEEILVRLSAIHDIKVKAYREATDEELALADRRR